jgi:MFS transporter, FHS family, glucose/mannose:H+ symporter
MQVDATASRFESLPAAPFYFGLAICGLVTVLLGPILPVISARWSMTDVQGGWLFTAQFSASVVGSVLSSYFPRKSVVLGFASISAGLAVLAAGHYAAAVLAFVLIGTGVGLAVSAINLIFGNEYPERRGALLTHVNLCWGIGAVLSPQLVALAEHAHALRTFLLATALCVVVAFVFFTPLLRPGDSVARIEAGIRAPASSRFSVAIFALFSLIMFLYIGTETTIAGWSATYAHRFGGLDAAKASSFVSVFWLSLVVGRGFVAALLKRVREQVILLAGIAAAMGGIVMLLPSDGFRMEFIAVVVAGLGCAPIFPLAVSKMFARLGRTRHAGWAFAICGSGGAVIPWITGVISQYSGGLRAAFVAPLGALAGILICVLVEGAMARPAGDFSVN